MQLALSNHTSVMYLRVHIRYCAYVDPPTKNFKVNVYLRSYRPKQEHGHSCRINQQKQTIAGPQ